MTYRATLNIGPYQRDSEYSEDEIAELGRDVNDDLAAELLVRSNSEPARRIAVPPPIITDSEPSFLPDDGDDEKDED